MTRREFIEKAVGVSIATGALCAGFNIFNLAYADANRLVDGKRIFYLKQAMYYKKLKNKRVECELCPRKCKVGNRERGACGVRENDEGEYYTLVYGNPASVNVDPIEKKPFSHFLPGTKAFSIATAGCNIVCKFCQNWQLSQSRPEQLDNINLPPEKVVSMAKQYGAKSVAFTYSEPVVFYEYMIETAKVARKNNVKSVVITNGYINPKPMEELCKQLDAVKVDFKGFTEKFYKETCAGQLKPVLEILQLLAKTGIWYELVYLVIPTLNDDEKDFRKMCVWIREKLGTNVPLHLSRFHPMYQLINLPQTPVSTIEKLKAIASAEGLKFAYIGNVPGHDGENTYCPKCKKLLINRIGYYIGKINLKKDKCSFCDESIPGVWE